jgi:hypothetical protein
VAAQNAGQPPAPAPAPVAEGQLTRDDVAKAIAAMPATSAAAAPPMPPVAADQDVLEPEWVDAAERIIAQTVGNPHSEEEAFEELQIDYLKKRYGHEVKKPDDA